MTACTGACCALFWWSRTPEQLQAWPLLAGGSTPAESRFIADMLVALDEAEARRRIDEFAIKTTYEEATSHEGRLLYTCRHWDERTRLCTVYEQRPVMCREFPYGLGCHACDFEIDTDLIALLERRSAEAGANHLELGYN